MQLHPTRATFHIALAGAMLVAIGATARLAPVVAFGGAMVLAVAVGRALALVSVTRLRAAGFEMVWTNPERVLSVARGESTLLEAELRNRGVDAVRAVGIRATASSLLDITLSPPVVDLAPGGRARVEVMVRGKRVGRWGVHGLALEVRGTPLGGEGLYEVPLLFANPVGIEVLPRALRALVQSPRGGRSRRTSELGRPANVAGEGDELRELREHVPGDPFKRIAWKASARRGQLLVREMEREERDVVWLVLDVSVELWAGAEGRAPLDEGVDAIAAIAARHLRRGDQVGLVVTASRLRTWLAPESGPAHAARLAGALASAASLVDADRCDLDELEIAQRVAEHARPLDPNGLADVARGDLDALARRADVLRARAPFAPRVPHARSPREQALRHYVAAFGMEVPPRTEGERERTEVTIAQAIERLVTDKPRPSVIHVWAPPPGKNSPVIRAIRLARARRVEFRWSAPQFDRSVGHDPSEETPIEQAVDEAVRIRARVSQARGERLLRRLGVKWVARAPHAGHEGGDETRPNEQTR